MSDHSSLLKEHIKGEVTLEAVIDGYLWYKTESGFPFSVPVEDTKGATFLLRDKGILFMRWIRKAMEEK